MGKKRKREKRSVKESGVTEAKLHLATLCSRRRTVQLTQAHDQGQATLSDYGKFVNWQIASMSHASGHAGQVGSFGESREILRSLYGSHASATRRSVGTAGYVHAPLTAIFRQACNNDQVHLAPS